MPLLQILRIGQAGSLSGGLCPPLGSSPKLCSPPVGGLLPAKPKLPLSLFSIAYHSFLLFLSPRSRQAEEYYRRMARGKTRPYDRLAVALTRFLGADRFQENIPRSAPFLRSHHS
jgi:hypothetical protein